LGFAHLTHKTTAAMERQRVSAAATERPMISRKSVTAAYWTQPHGYSALPAFTYNSTGNRHVATLEQGGGAVAPI